MESTRFLPMNGNYTTVLNSQVSCAYKPNGSGTIRTAYIKNMGWHFARYGGVAYPDDPLYCIEPWRSYAASTSGNSVDRDVTLDGSGSTHGSNVWYALLAERREAIGLILLYSNQMWDHSISVTTTSKANNPNVPLRVATQFLIYEIVCGLRGPSTFTLDSTNECGTAGDIFYNADFAEGTCTSEGLTDGKLISGEDRLVRFMGLHPQSLYRLTETKAPEGYQLLTEPVHEGGIQVGNEYFVQLTVVNAPVFELPMTGSMGGRWQVCFQLAGGFALLGLLIYIALKKRR